MVLYPHPIEEINFSQFGNFYDLRYRETDNSSAEQPIIFSRGEQYTDGYTFCPVISKPGSLGMTSSTALPCTITQMECHLDTQEAIFCIDKPLVFLAAPAADSQTLPPSAPNADQITAVLLQPGQVAVLNPGVWHSPAHGTDGPVTYYWLAEAYDGDPTFWQDIKNGPVLLQNKEV